MCCCRVAVCGRPALAAERLTAGLPLTEKRRIGASNRKIRAGSRQAGSAWINSLGGQMDVHWRIEAPPTERLARRRDAVVTAL